MFSSNCEGARAKLKYMMYTGLTVTCHLKHLVQCCHF